jgi:endonuclease-3
MAGRQPGRRTQRRASRQSKPAARTFDRVLQPLARRYDVDRFARHNGASPFRVLVGCILSLRTRDEVSFPATERLFARAQDPAGVLRLRESTIARLVYPAGFYRTKARQIRALSRLLLERHAGRVPETLDELILLPGVGRKTANLTVTLGFGKPGICVDTHVHRIANRLGWVRTRDPHATEMALRQILPPRWWIPINETLVRHGQEICKPISPVCTACPVARYCERRGVTRWR